MPTYCNSLLMFPYTGKSEMDTTNLGMPWTVFFPSAINSFQIEKYLIAALEVRQWDYSIRKKIEIMNEKGNVTVKKLIPKKEVAQCQRQDPPRRSCSNEESRSKMNDWQAWWDVQVPRFASNAKMLSSDCYYALHINPEKEKHNLCYLKENMQVKCKGCFEKKVERHTVRII